jgi:hypothetical protein
VSKTLIERLDAGDAGALGLDPDHIGYTQLGEMPDAPDKARRDAAAVSVAQL